MAGVKELRTRRERHRANEKTRRRLALGFVNEEELIFLRDVDGPAEAAVTRAASAGLLLRVSIAERISAR